MSVFVTKALQQVWCSPEMDYQRIFNPARLTSQGGILRGLSILFKNVPMPSLTERYHVFQLGNRTPHEMGISVDLKDKWVTVEDIINAEQMQLDVYTDIGKLLPAKDVYISRIEDTNLVIAIRDRGDIFGERTENIFLRSYSNAWLTTSEAAGISPNTFIKSTRVSTLADAAELINLYQDYSRRAGVVRMTCDGEVTGVTSVANVKIGGHYDLFYDGAVHWVTTLPVADLKIFNSHLDTTEKFIIHPPKALTGANNILYHDDVDFYIVTGNGKDRRGLYLHSNVAESQRMLTHNDYAIRTTHVYDLCSKLGVSAENCAVLMYIRKGRNDRKLSYERHFIHELYKLPDEDIIEIMAEEKASIEYWTASCLEGAYYTKLMRSGLRLVTEDDALKAFGYGGCTVETMQTPIAVKGSITTERPLGFRGHVLTLLTDRDTGKSDLRYAGPSTTVNTHEVQDGTIDFRLASPEHRRTIYHQIETFDLPNHLSFTAYRAPKENGKRSGPWENVTLTDDYAYEDGRFKWLIELPLYEVFVVPGDYSDLIIKTVDYPSRQVFDLKEMHNIDGDYIPTAEIRVVADNQLLTRGVDYHVVNGLLHICNYEVGQKTEVTVKIARIGCENDTPKRESGFVYNNTLSLNSHYDLHGSSVKSVTMGNKLLAHDELRFAENGGTSELLKNGQPYDMCYYRGPIADVPWWKVSDLRDDWDKTFSELESYLTSRMEEQDPVGDMTIERHYDLFSPMMHAIIDDIRSRKLNIGEGPFLDDRVRRICEGYEDLQAFEPTRKSNYDRRLLYVAPHTFENIVEVTEDEFYFINRVNDIYMNGELAINHFIGVANG